MEIQVCNGNWHCILGVRRLWYFRGRWIRFSMCFLLSSGIVQWFWAWVKCLCRDIFITLVRLIHCATRVPKQRPQGINVPYRTGNHGLDWEGALQWRTRERMSLSRSQFQFASCCWDKTLTKSSLGKKGFVWFYFSDHKSSTERRQCVNSRQEPEGSKCGRSFFPSLLPGLYNPGPPALLWDCP